jgi:plasmid maintenance system antidote protein VapI
VGNKEKIVGLGILGVLAFMHFRSKGINTILENKFDEAINVEKSLAVIPDIILNLQNQIKEVPEFRRFKPEQTAIIGNVQSFNADIRREIGLFTDIQQSLNLEDTLKI